jgi:hypothetical protein
MSQSNEPGREFSFAEEIARIAAPTPSPRIPRMRLLDVWNQFADGLRQTGIGADVRPSEDGTRYHLVLWPAHRPGWRTLTLTFRVTPTSVLIFQSGTTPLESPEELANWLREFAGGDNFQSTLQALREQAEEPVEARLMVQGAPDLLVQVSPETQRQIATATAEDITMTVELEEGDPIPDQDAIRALDSAGLKLQVVRAQARDRTVELQVRKAP